MARLPDPVPDLDDYGKAVYDKLSGPRKKLRGMYLSLMHNPKLAEHVGQLGTYFRFEGQLRGDLRELGILATARNMGTPFIWMQHVQPAKDEGLPDEVVEEVLHADPATTEIEMIYKAVWQAARHVVAQEVIPERLQSYLIAELGTAHVVELVAVCGFYRFIASVAVGFDAPLPPHDGPVPF